MFVLQPDAEYFKVDLPNSGEVILSKPLDYETKTLLTVTIQASVSYVHLIFCISIKKSRFDSLMLLAIAIREDEPYFSSCIHPFLHQTCLISVISSEDAMPCHYLRK